MQKNKYKPGKKPRIRIKDKEWYTKHREVRRKAKQYEEIKEQIQDQVLFWKDLRTWDLNFLLLDLPERTGTVSRESSRRKAVLDIGASI